MKQLIVRGETKGYIVKIGIATPFQDIIEVIEKELQIKKQGSEFIKSFKSKFSVTNDEITEIYNEEFNIYNLYMYSEGHIGAIDNARLRNLVSRTLRDLSDKFKVNVLFIHDDIVNVVENKYSVLYTAPCIVKGVEGNFQFIKEDNGKIMWQYKYENGECVKSTLDPEDFYEEKDKIITINETEERRKADEEFAKNMSRLNISGGKK